MARTLYGILQLEQFTVGTRYRNVAVGTLY